MSTPVPPDVERIVADYLRTHPAVRAVCRAVVSETPASTDAAWIRYAQIGRPTTGNSSAMHLSGYLIQLDCYASRTAALPRAEASRIARTVEAALADMAGAYGDERAVVTGVPPATISSTRIPDSMLSPSRERFVVNAIVHAHGQI